MDTYVNYAARDEAYSLPLDKIDVSDPRLYYNDTWYPYFERLRCEDPVHYTPDSPYGPYWAVTKYRDMVKVEVNHKVFSSSDDLGGIRIEDPDDVSAGIKKALEHSGPALIDVVTSSASWSARPSLRGTWRRWRA